MSSLNLAEYMQKDNAAFLMRQDSMNQQMQNSLLTQQMLVNPTSFTTPPVSAGVGSEQLLQTIKMLEMQRDALVASLKGPGLSNGQFGGAFGTVLEQPQKMPAFQNTASTPNLLSMLQQQTAQQNSFSVDTSRSNIDTALMGGHNGPQGYPGGFPDSVGAKRKGDFGDHPLAKKSPVMPMMANGDVTSLTGKAVLTAESACAIYRLRPKARGVSGTVKSHTGEIARTYGVTAKTIRDIWNRTTWAKDTKHLWTDEETQQYISQRARMSAKLDPTQNLPTWFAGAQ